MTGPEVRGADIAPAEPGTGSAADDGHTWWGRAWLEALEQRAQLDPNRLPRGRDYARSGAVGELALSPGEARAEVRGRKRSPYLTRVRVRRFTDEEWDRVLDVICAKLGRAAALLDGEVPPEVAGDLADAGLSLLPGAGEVGPRCSCPDDADPCKHAAAVCYLVADALDEDPFVALVLRGRTRGEVLAGLRARRRGATDIKLVGQDPGPGATARERPGHEPAVGRRAPADGKVLAISDRGVDARAVLGAPSADRPVPAPPVPPPRPGHPAALPIDPPPWRPAMREDLLGLAADAAHRAWELASGISRDADLGLDADADLARHADRVLGTPAFADLAERSGVDLRELARRALAWRYGGSPALEVLGVWWDPAADESSDPAELMKAAQAALREAADTTEVNTSGNQLTAAGMQLRLSRDLLWHPYALAEGRWEPAGLPQADPAQAVQAL